MLQINVDGKPHRIEMEANVPLPWVLRDGLKLTGTRYACGSSIVPVGGKAARSSPIEL